MTAKEKLLKIIKDARGDDLERAEKQFQGNEKLLKSYRLERAEWQAAYDLVEQIMEAI